VQMGYYDIPHRLDLRQLAKQTGISLGSLSELLRRAEAAILTHYVDSSLLGWPLAGESPPNPFKPIENLLQPAVLARAEQDDAPQWPASARGDSKLEWPLARHS
jgi:hypothetical protein